jgi:hypothetical protein
MPRCAHIEYLLCQATLDWNDAYDPPNDVCLHAIHLRIYVLSYMLDVRVRRAVCVCVCVCGLIHATPRAWPQHMWGRVARGRLLCLRIHLRVQTTWGRSNSAHASVIYYDRCECGAGKDIVIVRAWTCSVTDTPPSHGWHCWLLAPQPPRTRVEQRAREILSNSSKLRINRLGWIEQKIRDRYSLTRWHAATISGVCLPSLRQYVNEASVSQDVGVQTSVSTILRVELRRTGRRELSGSQNGRIMQDLTPFQWLLKYLSCVQEFLGWVEFEYKDTSYSNSTQERGHSTHDLDMLKRLATAESRITPSH